MFELFHKLQEYLTYLTQNNNCNEQSNNHKSSNNEIENILEYVRRGIKYPILNKLQLFLTKCLWPK